MLPTCFLTAQKWQKQRRWLFAVATAAGVPVLIEPIKISLLFAWAYAEAVYDVRTLLAGGGVSLLKTAQNWHYSLEGMLQYEGDTSVKDTQEKKPGELSYQEYLRLFLAAEGEEKKGAAYDGHCGNASADRRCILLSGRLCGLSQHTGGGRK